MLTKWIFLLLATAVMSELSGDVPIRKSHHVRLIYDARGFYVNEIDFLLLLLVAGAQ